MKMRRNTNLLVEPPSVATGDIAFNLIVFFLVCASVQPDSGRKQEIPKADSKQEQAQQSQNIEVKLGRSSVAINGDPLALADFLPRLANLLLAKTRPEDKVVIVKSDDDVPYHVWIQVTGWIEQAGGVITLQVEEEQTVETPG